jgi:hypothetical protein
VHDLDHAPMLLGRLAAKARDQLGEAGRLEGH